MRLRLGETESAATRGDIAAPARWPDAVAYREAVQDPARALRDAGLSGAAVRADRFGLPVTYTGRFAAVFRLRRPSDGTEWALRCFTSEGDAVLRAARYAALSAALADAPAAVRAAFVPSRYLPEGVRVGRETYPALVMGWAAGTPLGVWAEENRADPAALLRLGATLADLRETLASARFAHGDWQHDNLLVSDAGARVTLVDYDAAWTPALTELPPPNEAGHPNYRPPRVADADRHGPEMDRFPCLVLQTGLLALAADPSLWDAFADGDSLLLTRAAFVDPAASPVFAALRLVAATSPTLGEALRRLEDACRPGASPPEPLSSAAFREAAAARGLSLDRPAPLVGARPTPKIGPMAALPEAVTVSEGHRWWLESARGTARRARNGNALHRAGVWAANVSIVAFNAWLGGVAEKTHPFASSLTGCALATAVGYYLWPKNQAAIIAMEVEERNRERLSALADERSEIEKRLHAITGDPANRSEVAFVGARLGALELVNLGPILGLNAWDLDALRRAGMVTLADIDRAAIPLPGVLANALKAERERVLQQAKRDYAALAAERRDLRREGERLMRESDELRGVDASLRGAASRATDADFASFVGHLLGG